MAIQPTADPEDIRIIDATIQSELKMALFQKKIDQEDVLYLLIARLPEWGTRKFVLDMVNAAFDGAEEKARVGKVGRTKDRRLGK